MTRLLVSVRSAAEARAALAGGADLIDVKEPTRGSLGAADAATWSEVVAAVGGEAPVSVALGELQQGPAAIGRPLAGRLRFAKLGLAGCATSADWPQRWSKAITERLSGVPAVAVVYADSSAARAPPPEQVLHHALRLGCAGILVDTYDKSRGELFQYCSGDQLARWIDSARSGGLIVALAGSLTLRSAPTALRLAPDYVAVRGAVCRGGRTAAVDPDRVRQWAERVAQATPR